QAERRGFLDRIRSEAQRLVQAVDSLERGEEGPPSPLSASGILVVSSDAGLREIVRGVLERDGLRVVEAETPREAGERIRGGTPDAILLDLFMPRGAAFDVMLDARAASAGGRQTPILALAVLREGDRFEAADVHFRSKPIPNEDLLAAARAASSGDRTRRVLVVDDDRFLAEGIRTALAAGGFQAESMEAGEEALRTAARNPPGLIVLDLGLPDLDGIEVLRRLRSRPETRRTPVILLTGHAIPAGSSVPWSESVLGPQTFAAGIRAALRSAARI
ncbi:MAG: response regulator, partial [Planctomycetes bacterium]|nr:response regulator [Planctomycetota bacterium]